MSKPQTIKIDEVEYIRRDSVDAPAESLEGMEYVIVRSDRAGVFAGYLFSRVRTEVMLKQARRLWYWSGAASLSQLAMEGVQRPDKCKFPITVPTQQVFGVIEVIPATEKARKSIAGVPVWKI